MSSRVFQVNSRVTRQRVTTQSPARSSNVPGRTSSASNSLARMDAPPSTHRVSGRSTVEEVRRRQMLRYSEDKEKFQQKQKEKADKKRAEKFERYSHIDIGRRVGELQVNSGDDGTNMISVRERQATEYAESSPNAIRIEQEREEMRAKREERKREEKLKKYAHITTGQQLSQENIPSPSSSSQTATSPNTAQAEKEEEFRRQMRENRERMQNKYNEQIRSVP